MIATPQMALEAAARVARAAGVESYILGDAIEGEARDVVRYWRPWRCRWQSAISPSARPAYCSPAANHGHRTRQRARGRNVEYLLSLAIALEGHPRIHALAGDTDGVDGQKR